MSTGQLEVLIVDDSPIIAERLRDMLDDMSNISKISIASDFDAAEGLLIRNRPDIVLLDINLPDKSGIDLLRMINAKQWKIKVIMITNQVNDYYKSVCKSLGANYFFDKSNEFEKIPDAIAKLS